ncbi:CTU2 [Acanthosepion pharaonis]|uniref:Cytoplasmic tRNA 2-thiolation protein 2 n=1 Tax=Acanthosepion pharaonis TaxID=158019 RepID=A0A812B0J1_ACAPH|nr:CTU2 [Sepia pharaonis]
MCSRVEEDFTDGPVRKLKSDKVRISRLCMKCGENEGKVVIRMNDPFCWDCFLVYVVHKFRAVIGKSKLIRDAEAVLLAYSGGSSSSALLHLVHDGMEKSKFKKLRFKADVVYIDEGATFGWNWEKRQEIVFHIVDFCKSFGFTYYITSIEQVFKLIPHSKGKDLSAVPTVMKNCCQCVPQNQDLEEKLLKLLDTCKNLTFKERLVHHLRTELLIAVALMTGNSKVMLGTSGNRLAVQMLSDIAQGRGAHVALNTGFSDARNEDIMIVRPLKDFTNKEVALYNRFNSVESVTSTSVTTMTTSRTSIERLTEKFVTGLQTEYPSTVCNITRTAEKLDSHLGHTTESRCALCKAWLDTSVDNASALNSLRLSHVLSKGGSLVQQNGIINGHDSDDLSDLLCYGCQAVVSQLASADYLPQHMKKSEKQQNLRLLQKESIQNFLIDES